MLPTSGTSAIKLPFAGGEYLSTWQIPDHEGSYSDFPGLLTVAPGEYPTATVYGDLPTESPVAGMTCFPQRHRFDVLTGRVSSGAHVALMNGEIAYDFPGSGRAIGALAALSLDPFESTEHRRYCAIEFQIEGLESIAGLPPVSEVKIPMNSGAESIWQATVDTTAAYEWETDAASMAFSYRCGARVFDFYGFEVVFGPVLRLCVEQPLTIQEWWQSWVRPVQQLVSLITGGRREVRYLLASLEQDNQYPRYDQIYGFGLPQAPVNSSQAAVRQIHSAVDLSRDGISLLDLVQSWQQHEEVCHPLFETYGTLAVSSDQHPRSRFLLLLQALEGSYGFENRAHLQTSADKYQVKRDQLLERIKENIEPTDLRFLSRNLAKVPKRGLDTALRALLQRMPASVSDELAETAVVKSIKEVPGQEKTPTPAALAKTRNVLSHGSGSFASYDLEAVADIMERVLRAEALRLLGAPPTVQERALTKH